MAVDLQELRDKRAQLVAEARKMQDTADTEKRELTAEERERWDTIFADVDKLGDELERRNHLLQTQKMLETPEETGGKRTTGRQELERSRGDDKETADSKAADAYRSYLKGGAKALNDEQKRNLESRALQAGVDTAGGYLYPDEQFVARLIQSVDNLLWIRRMATVQLVSGTDSLGYPTLDNNPAAFAWTTELLTGNEDSTMSMGKRALQPHPAAGLLKVSNTLLQRSAIPVDQLVRDRLAYNFATLEETAFMTGTGAQQPLGVFTASANGISTGQDVSTGNSTTAIAADNLIECVYTLKPQYWDKVSWVFHRDALKMIRKLKDGNGQYLWSPGLQSGQPDMILNHPVRASEYAPNTFTTGLYVGILGDFSQYYIADAMSYRIYVANELYVATNQVGYFARAEIDGMPVLEEAFVRVTLA